MTMHAEFPDDGPVEPSGSGFFRGVVFGVLGTVGIIAAVIWIATVLA